MDLIDTSKIIESKLYDLSELLQDNIYLCEVKIETYNITKVTESLIQMSIITDILYSKSIAFISMDEEFTSFTLPIKVHDALITCKHPDIIPLKYFSMAEKIEYPHFKYLEYYHIIEYFFMAFSKKKISKIMSDLLTDTFMKNKSLDETFLYNTYREFFNPHKKKHDFTEATQIIDLFKSLDVDTVLTSIVSSEITIKKLFENLQGIPKTGLKDDFFNPNKTAFNKIYIRENKDNFLESLAMRVYKVRNYLVHTKKGEDTDRVFHPTHKNMKVLVNDVLLIRELARLIMVKAATSNDF